MTTMNMKYEQLFLFWSTLKLPIVFIAILSILQPSRSASAAAITLGTAANYGVLVGAGQTLDLNGSVAISGNVGVGANSSVQTSGINFISGTAYEDKRRLERQYRPHLRHRRHGYDQHVRRDQQRA
jgi:hypothetical protein